MKKLLMKSISYLCLSSMAFVMSYSLTACSSDDKPFVDNEPVAVKDTGESDVVKGISVSLSDFALADATTRTAYSDVDGGVKVTWAQGDTIGIFPNVGGQVEFPIQAGTESNQAEFDGGGWALRSNSTYAAYYPYKSKNCDYGNKRIQLNYTGQKQVDNGSTVHLGQYDYQATGGVKTNNSGYLNFQFKHLGALMAFNLTVPKAGTYRSLTLTSSEEVFVTKAELDISGQTPVLKPTETSKTFTLSLDDIKLQSDNAELTAYMMLAPVDLSQGSLDLTLDGDRIFTATLDGHNLEAGKQYNIEKTLVEGTPSPNQIIAFADENVKAICVANWDTNGDGELSYEEAAAVTDIGNKFNTKTKIKSFDEFQYFTGVRSVQAKAFMSCIALEKIVLPNSLQGTSSAMFDGCVKLKNVTIPEGVTSLGSSTFNNCPSLTEIILPTSLTSIGSSTFNNCPSLTEIILPSSLTSIGRYAFSGCSRLISIEIPESVTSIGSGTFSGCSSLISIEIPESVTSIGSEAFSGCSSLTNIVIPDGVTSIEDRAFTDCRSLTCIEIPEGVSSIGYDAFFNCSSLTSIEIPIGVTSIGGYAFCNCISLQSITCLPLNPPIMGTAFDGSSITVIYVPATSVIVYKTAKGWSYYASKIQAMPE